MIEIVSCRDFVIPTKQNSKKTSEDMIDNKEIYAAERILDHKQVKVREHVTHVTLGPKQDSAKRFFLSIS